MKYLSTLALLIFSMVGLAQQPQTQTAPLFAVNAKYTNGVAPGFWPTAGSGLTLNVSAGTVYCSVGNFIDYAGGSVGLASSNTNYVYLNGATSCTITANTTGFTTNEVPIAIVTTNSTSITNIRDVRTFMSNVAGGSGGSGIASINSQTGPAIIFQSTGGTIGISTPSANVINLESVAGGISGGYPSTTAIVIGGVSSIYDDGDSNSPNLGVPSSVSCDGGIPTTTCTFVLASAPTIPLAVKGAVDTHNLSSWPAGPTGDPNQQGAQYGSFQIATVTDPTHFTITTPARTPSLTYSCSPCTGNLYDASYWGIWKMAAGDGFYGHGTVYGFEATTANLVTNFATWTSGISGTPKVYIDESGQNDFFAGASLATVEASHQSLWTAARTAGYQVWQATMTPASYGLSGVGFKPFQINQWYWEQWHTSSNDVSGQYFDYYVDAATYLSEFLGGTVMPDHTANEKWAAIMNHAFSGPTSVSFGFPRFGNYSQSTLGGNIVPTYYVGQGPYYVIDDSANLIEDWKPNSGYNKYYWTVNGHANAQLYPTLGAGANWCPYSFGVDDSNNNNSFYKCLHFTGTGSTSNYEFGLVFGATAGTGDTYRYYADGKVGFPASLGTTPSTSPVCPNGTNGTLTTTGCATGGGIGYSVTLNTGVAASPALPNQIAPITGSITGCKFLTQTSDGVTALTFNIKENGVSILSGSSATIAAGTASQTVTTLTLTGTISVTAGQIWETDITSGTSSWTGSLVCY